MNYDQYKTQFDRDGFVIIRGFLDAGELAKLKGELDRYIRDIVPGLSDAHAFYQDRERPETLKQMQHMAANDPFFETYRSHPKWKALAETLIGEPAAAQEPEWFNKPPGTEHPTPPHQDNYYFNLKPPHVLTIWMALDHVDAENGCLRYVAGSHERGVRPHGRSNVLGFSQGITDFGPADQAQETEVHLAPGDVAVHHGWTIHRAEPNRSATRSRRSFAMVFRGQSCDRDEAGYQRYVANLQAQHAEMGLKS